ncbi:MAG: hypothetical protein SNH27_12030 [Rikenellaceae bacterium]
MKQILLSLIAVVSMTSCSFKPYLSYNVGLSNVEAPADVKEQYGDTKIVTLDVEGKTNYKYEDDYIDISWFVGSSQFSFVLKNKSDYSIKIPWDDVTYINTAGSVGRVMHSGVKYTDRNASQPASIVPKGATLSDIVLPTDNVYYVSGQYGGWRTSKLFNFLIDKNNIAITATPYIGKTVKILLPVLIEDVRNEYVFEFRINDITAK